MTESLVGYARVSTDKQDTQLQRDELERLGVLSDRIYVDEGKTGRNRDRPGLEKALAACWPGSTLVVTKLDRLARSVPDLRAIAAELQERGVSLSIGGSISDPTSPAGKLFFNTLAMFAEFEADLISARTKEGMALAKKKGRLKGRQPKLSPRQQEHAVALVNSGNYSVQEVADLVKVSRATVYRALERARANEPTSTPITLPRVDSKD